MIAEPLMTEQEATVLEIWIWFAIVFLTIILATWAWRRITRQSDAIAEAAAATAEAERIVAEAQKVLDEVDTIESYLDDWSDTSTKTAIAETRALDKDRS